ncbi:uncharacterized protein A4U43_UnF2160 [Asparagus officinalis]|uniref:Uncharacterized protein n=1 Tax=Asparagus officinalis TaxID=4686 RepID=A0A1R3L7C3_ASPOF|nr:uncharacterized protein A4U43_UnF2160 [Asparagus officinalis]
MGDGVGQGMRSVADKHWMLMIIDGERSGSAVKINGVAIDEPEVYFSDGIVDLAPEEAAEVHAQVTDVAAKLVRSLPAAGQVEKRRKLKKDLLKVAQYEKEPTLENRHQPTRHLDVRASMLESRVAQLKAVEQFWLPRDEEISRKVLDVGLHLSLGSYLVRRALVERESMLTKENELGDWHREMEVWESMIDSLKASDSQKFTNIDTLQHELHEQNKMINFLSEEVS